MIRFTSDSAVQFKQNTVHFNGGELHPTVQWGANQYLHKIKLYCLIKTTNDLMELAMVKDAIDRINTRMVLPIELEMPYIPYARQDRVANTGEALGIKVFATMLNTMNFSIIKVHDAHSPVALALLERVTEVPQHVILSKLYELHNQDIIVAPDAGALKKAELFAAKVDLPILTATKSRNTLNGQLSMPIINYTNQITREYAKERIAKGGSLVVVDDICDAGGTFIQLGKAFVDDGLIVSNSFDSQQNAVYKGAKLLVTHGIFANNAKARLGIYFEEVKAVHDWTTGE
jgi:ribose-phosphate pyrophosphokinase